METTTPATRTKQRRKSTTTTPAVMPYIRKSSKIAEFGSKTIDVSMNTLDMLDQTQLAYIDTMKTVRDMLAEQRIGIRLDLIDDMKARGMSDAELDAILDKYCTPGA